jgi:hypothetical protein
MLTIMNRACFANTNLLHTSIHATYTALTTHPSYLHLWCIILIYYFYHGICYILYRYPYLVAFQSHLKGNSIVAYPLVCVCVKLVWSTFYWSLWLTLYLIICFDAYDRELFVCHQRIQSPSCIFVCTLVHFSLNNYNIVFDRVYGTKQRHFIQSRSFSYGRFSLHWSTSYTVD